jgi:hypothetical protein
MNWSFQNTNFIDDGGYWPLLATNVSLYSTGGVSALVVDSTNAASLRYNITEQDQTRNLTVDTGSIEFWFSPLFSPTNLGGAGLRHAGRFIDIGSYTTNSSSGWWSCYLDESGCRFVFSAQTNGAGTNYITAPIDWSTNFSGWKFFALTWSPTNTAFYLDGTLVTNGPGLTYYPGPDALTNGFAFGSDIDTGLLQVQGMFADIYTYDFPLTPDNVASDFLLYSIFVSPLVNITQLFSAPSSPTNDPGFRAITGTGFLTYLSNATTCVTSSNIWITNAVVTRATNGTLNFRFELAGGSNSYYYDVFATTALATSTNPATWAWFGQGPSCAVYLITNLPTGAVYFILGQPLDSDNDGLTDAFEKLVSHTDPLNPDTLGTGLLDGFQFGYFGTMGVDAFADPAGDGWSNLYKQEHGMDPRLFYTPPPPQNVAARLDNTGTNVTITWQSGGGPVANYIVETQDTNYVTQVSASTFSVTFSTPYAFIGSVGDPPGWFVRANFTNGMHADSALVRVSNSSSAVQAALVRGPLGARYLAVQSVPADLSRLLVYWATNGPGYFYLNLYPSNLVAGVAQLPYVDNFDGGFIGYQAIGTNAEDFGPQSEADGYPTDFGALGWFSAAQFSFVDARPHLKENLKFLLRSATTTAAFSYATGLGTDGTLTYRDISEVSEPENFYARPPSSGSYEYYGYHYFSSNLNYAFRQELRPVQENYLWRNFVYNAADVSSGGDITTGIDYDTTWPNLRLLDGPKYTFSGAASNTAPLAFTATNSTWFFARWIYGGGDFSQDLAEPGLLLDSSQGPYLPAGVRNLYGLAIGSVLMHADGYVSPVTLSAGGAAAWPPGAGSADYYPSAAAPSLQTVDYYFVTQTPYFNYGAPRPPLPGSPDFTTTNTSPLLIAGFGQPITVSGWAKMTNGFPGKYAYLEQYFDKALKIDASGGITANQTGVLSPYGEFFPTDPGQVALATMPDIDTGLCGTGIVSVIKLQLDVNHDGTMDLTFAGPDNTSQARPFTFWVNNNYDRFTLDADDGVPYDDDVSSTSNDAKSLYTGKFTPDYNYTDAAGNRTIPCFRDLQDFARLWIFGISTNLLTNLPPSTTVTLSWGDIGAPNSANPTIDLFEAADPDGGIGYLTNSLTASLQMLSLTSPYIGRLGPGQSIKLNASQFTNNWAGNFFIWCGVSNGSGALTLTISQGGTNTLAQTTAYIQLVDIKQMYERWTVGDYSKYPIMTNTVAAPDGLPAGILKFEYPAPNDTNTAYILFVHGWNMEPWEKDRFAESAFKRLFWQGYQGRFGSFRWPTENGFKGISSMATNPSEKDNFDRSEYTAWRSGAPLLNKLNDLNRLYPGHVYLLAHSMGNIVAGEALRLAGASQVVNTYVASQTAVSAHTYDTNIPNYSFSYSPLVFQCNTPNIYGNWFQGNYGGGAGTVVNFYNTNDYALQRSVWQLNQLFKPDQFVLMNGTHWDYSYVGMTNDPPPWNHFDKAVSLGFTIVDFDIVNVLTNRYEVMALAAESWTTALGATPGVQNVRRSVDLEQLWPPDLNHPTHPFDEHFYHSAEFRGDYWQQQGYWRELLGSDAFKLK